MRTKTNWLAENDGRRVTVDVPATTANLGAGLRLRRDGPRAHRTGSSSRSGAGARAATRSSSAAKARASSTAASGNRFIVGLEAALRAAGVEIAEATTLAPRDDEQDPAGARPRIERRGHRRRACSPATAWPATPSRARTCSGWRPRSRVTRTMPRRRCSAASSPRRSWATRSRRSGSTSRAACGPSSSSPTCGSRPPRCARSCPRASRERTPSRISGRVAIGVAGMASGRVDVLRYLMEDRLHEPYRAAVYPQLHADGRRRARRRRPRCQPQRCGFVDHRLRADHRRRRPDRGGVPGRGRGLRPAGPRGRGRAAQRRRRHRAPEADRERRRRPPAVDRRRHIGPRRWGLPGARRRVRGGGSRAPVGPAGRPPADRRSASSAIVFLWWLFRH